MKTTIAVSLDNPAEKHLLARCSGLGQDGHFYRQANAFANGTEMPFAKLLDIRTHYVNLLERMKTESEAAYWEQMFLLPDGTRAQNTGLVYDVPNFIKDMVVMRRSQVDDVQQALDLVDGALALLSELVSAADSLNAKYGYAEDEDVDA